MKALNIFYLSILILGLSACNTSPTKIACVGDSITEGAGHKWQSASAYPVILDQLLGDEYAVLNNGRSGTTAQIDGNFPYWKCKELSNTFVFQPDIIIIKLGSNDCKAKNWNTESFTNSYQALIDTFSTIQPQPKIILCTPVPAIRTNFGIRDSVIVNGVIPIVNELARTNNLQVIDLHTPLLEYPQCLKDGIHPNEEGAVVMAKVIAKELAK